MASIVVDSSNNHNGNNFYNPNNNVNNGHNNDNEIKENDSLSSGFLEYDNNNNNYNDQSLSSSGSGYFSPSSPLSSHSTNFDLINQNDSFNNQIIIDDNDNNDIHNDGDMNMNMGNIGSIGAVSVGLGFEEFHSNVFPSTSNFHPFSQISFPGSGPTVSVNGLTLNSFPKTEDESINVNLNPELFNKANNNNFIFPSDPSLLISPANINGSLKPFNPLSSLSLSSSLSAPVPVKASAEALAQSLSSNVNDHKNNNDSKLLEETCASISTGINLVNVENFDKNINDNKLTIQTPLSSSVQAQAQLTSVTGMVHKENLNGVEMLKFPHSNICVPAPKKRGRKPKNSNAANLNLNSNSNNALTNNYNNHNFQLLNEENQMDLNYKDNQKDKSLSKLNEKEDRDSEYNDNDQSFGADDSGSGSGSPLTKRARNKLSACLYRQRKKAYMAELEGELNALKEELKESNARLRAVEYENRLLNNQIQALKANQKNDSQNNNNNSDGLKRAGLIGLFSFSLFLFSFNFLLPSSLLTLNKNNNNYHNNMNNNNNNKVSPMQRKLLTVNSYNSIPSSVYESKNKNNKNNHSADWLVEELMIKDYNYNEKENYDHIDDHLNKDQSVGGPFDIQSEHDFYSKNIFGEGFLLGNFLLSFYENLQESL